MISEYDINQIIIIQKNIRGYLVKKFLNIHLSSSYYQTKECRINIKQYKNDKSNECEKLSSQINLIEQIIKIKLNKTDDRINIELNNIINNINPIVNNDGYEWCESFDGKIIIFIIII